MSPPATLYAADDNASASNIESDTPQQENAPVDKKTAASDAKAEALPLSATPPGIFEGGVGKGALLSPLLSESFQTDLATGSATVSIPIIVPPGRKNMQPILALSYSSNNPNGICGVGWGLTTSSIQRSTKKGTPKYNSSDTFIFVSSGSSGELILINETNKEYRQKIEGAFSRYIFDTANSKWDVWDKNGTKYTFGGTSDSKIVNSDGTKIFAWYLNRAEDVYGNAVVYTYETDISQIHLQKIQYTSNSKVSPALNADKTIRFLYEFGRPDIIYNQRSGWEMVTRKRLIGIQIMVDDVIKWSYWFSYSKSQDTDRSLLREIILRDANGNPLPSKKFAYQTIK